MATQQQNINMTMNIEKMTINQLKQLCRDNNFKGFSKKKKADLIVFIKNQQKQALLKEEFSRLSAIDITYDDIKYALSKKIMITKSECDYWIKNSTDELDTDCEDYVSVRFCLPFVFVKENEDQKKYTPYCKGKFNGSSYFALWICNLDLQYESDNESDAESDYESDNSRYMKTKQQLLEKVEKKYRTGLEKLINKHFE